MPPIHSERFMPGLDTTAIYMIKKSADGFLVSFRRGTDHGVRPGMQLPVVNEDGFRVGVVEVVASTESESEALAAGGSGIELGCMVSLPEGVAPGREKGGRGPSHS
jgi:hypothetical protein